MKICEIMTRNVETVQANTSLADAALKMRDYGVGILPVYHGDTLTGVITDRDIVVRSVAQGLDPMVCKVENAMTWRVEHCWENDTVEYAAKIMERYEIRRLLVLDSDVKLVGVVSLSDIAQKTHNATLVDRIFECITR